MASILIIVIYLAFISMGLPDALLGSAWPTIYEKMQVPVSYAGLLTIIIASGTVVSSLLSDKMQRRFGTAVVTVFCTFLTAVALFGFSISTAFWQLCLWAIPYGLGAGSIDAALNNYVALHYKSKHMSFIHFFWGLGATAGPYVMGALLTGGQAWNAGYRTVGIAQTVMTVLLFASLPLWKKNGVTQDSAQAPKTVTPREALRLPGAKAVLIAFFCYCAMESTAGLWASSYMTLNRGISADVSAKWASLFFLGITAGRFLCAFISDRIGDKNMIRVGQGFMLLGVATMFLPLGNTACFVGLIFIGLGCAPVYPCLLHETPQNFGADKSQAIMGIQMACAYTGSTLMPPVFGFIAEHISIGLYPVYLLLFVVVMIAMVEKLNKTSKELAPQA